MAYLIFPNQLFAEIIETGEKVYLVEEERFFTDFDFNKKKLVLHRASMKAFEEKLENPEYIEYDQDWQDEIDEEVKVYNPVDNRLERKLERSGIDFDLVKTPMFLNSMEENSQLIDDYYHKRFYRKQRKRLDILVDKDRNPEGGKWSFDPENREKMPEDEEPPEIPEFSSKHVEEAKEYVKENFPDNPGTVEDFFWPITNEQAMDNLEDFLENRMEKFGRYQDAIDRELKFGYHSLLSSSLNIGLLTPEQVVEKTLEYHEEKDYPLNSLEGFIRQVIGWREYIRAMYRLEGEEMRDSNFWGNENPVPDQFYSGETGIEPVDVSIENAKRNAYGHHIERLMVLGNMMLLLEIDPDEVYDWFMEMFIDSYDWVMVPNVYGMSQYADNRMMTKPYISSSNYIKKMSHYSGDWEDWWDGLYWSFIEEHREKIDDIQRMSFMTSTLDRMSEETLKEHEENADEFREELGLD